MVKRKTAASKSHSPGDLCYQLKVTLEEIQPPVWRRLLVPSDIRLHRLHDVLQAAFAWKDCHLHCFQSDGAEYGLPDPDGDWDTRYLDEKKYRLCDLAGGPDQGFHYQYDFGDDWLHEVLVEKVLPMDPSQRCPACTGGARACPPEDVGGPSGYQEFLEAILDPAHEEHESWLEWIGGSFDPEAFDVKEANARVFNAYPTRKKAGSPNPRAKSAVQAEPIRATSKAPVSTVLPFSLESGDSDTAQAIPPPSAGAESSDAQPTLEEWRALYAAAGGFKEIEPWGWMWDKDLFGVQNPQDGQVGYCCVMGALGQHLALAVYRGARGYASWKRIQKEGRKKKPDTELFFIQDCLMASWEDRDQLEPEDLKVTRALGLSYRGCQAWPLFRSWEPGCVPTPLTPPEASFLTQALEQGRKTALRMKEDPTLIASRGDRILCRGRKGTGQEWEDRWVVPEQLPPPPEPSPGLDAGRLDRVTRTCERVNSSWQVDRFHLPVSVFDEDRPFFPVLFLAVDPHSGMIVGQGLSHPREGLSPLAGHLLGCVEEAGMIPQELHVRRPELLSFLAPVARSLGILVRLTKSLRELDGTRREMERLIARNP